MYQLYNNITRPFFISKILHTLDTTSIGTGEMEVDNKKYIITRYYKKFSNNYIDLV